MVGAQDIWAGMDLYRATHAVTQVLCFSGLIRRTAPFRGVWRIYSTWIHIWVF
jgi:hypothetical protein